MIRVKIDYKIKGTNGIVQKGKEMGVMMVMTISQRQISQRCSRWSQWCVCDVVRDTGA